jgi:hypothetical protein
MNSFYGKSFAIVALVVGAAATAGAAAAQTAAPAPAPAANAPAATVADAPPANAPAATVADAPPAKAPVAAKPHKKVTPSVVVLVTNSRAVALTELDAAPEGDAQGKAIVSNLAPGKKTSVKIAHGKSCVFDLHGAFADGSVSDSASVDLCKDKKVNLVE